MPLPIIAPPMPLLISEADAAKLLNISQRSLFKLRQSGQIPHIRLNGRILYSPVRLRQIAEGQIGAQQVASA